MNSFLTPRLLAGFSAAALLAAAGLFASSRPAHSAGGPIAVAVANTPLAVTASPDQPVEVYALLSTNTYGNHFYIVPAGKQLVVESMTLLGGSEANNYTGVVHNELRNGITVSYATLTAPASTNSDVAAVTQPMHFTVAPGGKIEIDLYLRASVQSSAYVSLSGRLVDAP